MRIAKKKSQKQDLKITGELKRCNFTVLGKWGMAYYFEGLNLTLMTL